MKVGSKTLLVDFLVVADVAVAVDTAWVSSKRSGALRVRVERAREGGAGSFGVGFARGARFGGAAGGSVVSSSFVGVGCLVLRFLGGAFVLRGGFLVVFLGAGASSWISSSS